MTPFNKKKINLDEAKSNTGNLTCRLSKIIFFIEK